MIKLDRTSNVKIKWTCYAHEYNKENEREIISAFSKKYNIPKNRIKVEVELKELEDTVSIQESIGYNIQDPIFQQQLFADYIKLNEIKDINFDIITKIDNQINEKINYDIYSKYGNIILKKLEWSNFLSFGKDNSFDFTNLKGLVSLSSIPSNQGGKTTFALSLLSFCLYGSGGDKAKTLDKLFNRFTPNENELYVRCFIEINNIDYVIERVLTRPKKRGTTSKASQTVKYYKIINGLYDINDPLDEYDEDTFQNQSTDHTNKTIKESLCSQDDFNLIAQASGKTLDSLILDIGDTARCQLFNRWVGLLPIQEKADLAKEKWTKDISPKLLSNIYTVEQLQEDIITNKNNIEQSNKIISETNIKLKNVDVNLIAYQKEKDETLALKSKVDETLLKLDIKTQENKKSVLIENGKSYRTLEKEYTDKINELKDFKCDRNIIDKNNKEIIKLTSEIATIKSEINNLKNTNDKLNSSRSCPTCKRPFDDDTQVEINKQIEENNAKIKALIPEGVKKNELKQLLEKENENLQEIYKKVEERNKLELKQAQNKVLLEKTTNEYKDIVNLIKDYESNKDIITKNSQIDIKITNINTRIQTENSVRDSLLKMTKQEEMNIEIYNKKIKENEEIIKKMYIENEYVKHFKLYQNLVGKKGIQTILLNKVLPIINSHVNNLLNDIPFSPKDKFNVEVVMDDKNNVKFEIIQETLNGDVMRGDLSSASGYELVLSSIAIRSALAKISSFTKINFMLLDEVTGRVAEENLEYVQSILNKIVQDYQFIFLISHNKTVNEWCEQKIVVIKDDNRISRISIN
jgi:DNA repair exonuclease SbcCD ATPase subunit